MKNCFHFFAMQRTGQHAIMRWLMQGFQNVRELNWQHPPYNRPLTEEGKDNFFINSENILVPETRDDFIRDESEYCVHIYIILRDPFNMFASRMTRRWSTNKLKHPLDQQRDLWINHATGYLFNKIATGINYNEWFVSETYRKQLCSPLGIPVIPRMEKVPKSGKGSSFDKQKMYGFASKMKVFERWKQLEDDIFYDQYKKLFTKEVIDLSVEIFGEQFVSSIIDSVYWNAN